MSKETDMEDMVKQNSRECPHCKFLYETFLKDSDPYSGELVYYLMTEVFVYLHGGDVCTYFQKESKCLRGGK